MLTIIEEDRPTKPAKNLPTKIVEYDFRPEIPPQEPPQELIKQRRAEKLEKELQHKKAQRNKELRFFGAIVACLSVIIAVIAWVLTR